MAFTFIQGLQGTPTANGISTVTLPGVGYGHLICVVTVVGLTTGSISTVTVQDGSLNNYTITPNSPVKYGSGGDDGYTALAYFLHTTPGNTTITSTWTGGTINSSLTNAYEFSYTGGVKFDLDASANNGGAAAPTPITVPSVTPTQTGSLLFGAWNTDNGAENSANSPWTNPPGLTVPSEAYIISSVYGATAGNFNDTSTPDIWTSSIMVFYSNTIYCLGHT